MLSHQATSTLCSFAASPRSKAWHGLDRKNSGLQRSQTLHISSEIRKSSKGWEIMAFKTMWVRLPSAPPRFSTGYGTLIVLQILDCNCFCNLLSFLLRFLVAHLHISRLAARSITAPSVLPINPHSRQQRGQTNFLARALCWLECARYCLIRREHYS